MQFTNVFIVTWSQQLHSNCVFTAVKSLANNEKLNRIVVVWCNYVPAPTYDVTMPTKLSLPVPCSAPLTFVRPFIGIGAIFYCLFLFELAVVLNNYIEIILSSLQL